MSEKCSATVDRGDGRWSQFMPCDFKAKVQRVDPAHKDLRWFCGVHDPVRLQEKRNTKTAEYNADRDKRVAHYRRENASYRTCIDVPLEALEDGSVKEYLKTFI